MTTVSVVKEDNIISVNNDAREGAYTFPSNLWAIQWDGSAGHAEWTNGPNTDLVAADVDSYIAMWEAEAPAPEVPLTAQEIINSESFTYLANTDWYVTRFAETGVAVPADITTARSDARSAIVV